LVLKIESIIKYYADIISGQSIDPSSIDILIAVYFVLAGAGALLIALATISFQALKAALANPVKSLRSE
jgi:hypothetical protein